MAGKLKWRLVFGLTALLKRLTRKTTGLTIRVQGADVTSKCISYYSDVARRYDSLVSAHKYLLPQKLVAIEKLYPLPNSSKILDIGIGTGLSTEYFARRGHCVTGIDGSNEMLEIATRKAIFAELILADVESLYRGGGLGKFDGIFCVGMLEFLPSIKDLLEFIKLCSHCGTAIFIALREKALNPWLTEMIVGGRRIDMEAFNTLGITAFHYEWCDLKRELTRQGYDILYEQALPAYISPTQGHETINRVVLARLR